jgi:hypothetical protein
MKTIKLDSNKPSFGRKLILDSKQFNLEFLWNNRCMCWVMNITDEIAYGITLLKGRDLLDGFRNNRSPDCELYLIGEGTPNLENISNFELLIVER